MDKAVIRIEWDYIFGPVQFEWLDVKGNPFSNIQVIDDNKEILKLNKKANDLWLTSFEKVTGYRELIQRKDKLLKVAPQILELTERIISILNEINDGSYEVVDKVTPSLRNLLSK